MANYGRTTQGASWRDIEIDVVAREITVPGGETGVAIWAYLQTTNGVTADCKAVLYNPADDTIAYQSGQITFSDDTGGWKSIAFTTTVAAGTYLLSIGAGSIAGGANTVNIAYDTVGSTTTLRENTNILAGAQSTYPTFPSPITWSAANNTQDISLYLETSSAGSPKRMLLMGVG